MKTKIQICVSAKTKEETEKAVSKILKLKDELDELYGNNYTVHSCLLPKHILKEMGFDSTLVDTLINTFRDKYSTDGCTHAVLPKVFCSYRTLWTLHARQISFLPRFLRKWMQNSGWCNIR